MTTLEKSTSNILVSLFYDILRIRMVEERIASKYPEQKMRCPVHLSIGQEAVAVGVCKAALHSDYLVSGHRAHAHYLAKGGDLKAMIAEIYGKATGCAGGRGGSMHLVDQKIGMMGCTPIIGSSMPIALGLAFASIMKKENRVTIVCFGDACEEGIFAECLNFSALKKLPVLFLCENNLYSVYSPLSVRQPATRDLITIANGHGVWAKAEFGNDVLKVHSLAQSTMDHISSGNGPALLEFSTYRYREHCGPYFDKDLDYRTKEELEKWENLCPIKQTQEQLLARGVLNSDDIEQIKIKINNEIDEAFLFAEQSSFPNPLDPQPLYYTHD
jgi:TPP-dependent pyruvate/acetoin dehydrogenase alpha subunit